MKAVSRLSVGKINYERGEGFRNVLGVTREKNCQDCEVVVII